ncbi:MAG: SufE family protein [Candidatus Omnitrophica bacterium]|nr:SufE family protein [Candidatus Omnitrophota bacterium]
MKEEFNERGYVVNEKNGQTIAEREREIVDNFAILSDWEEKYRLIIDMGRKLPEFPEEHRTEANKVKGCQSQVWFHAWLEEDHVRFVADSDAAIVRGLIAILLKTFSDAQPREIMDASTDFLNEMGLGEHLSPTRSNGLAAMIKQIKYYALAFNTLLEQKKSAMNQ